MAYRHNSDFYVMLGVSYNASVDEIERVRRRFACQLHPDLHPNDPTAEARLKEVNAACDALIAAAKRAQSRPPMPDYYHGDVLQEVNLTFAEAQAGCCRTFQYHRPTTGKRPIPSTSKSRLVCPLDGIRALRGRAGLPDTAASMATSL